MVKKRQANSVTGQENQQVAAASPDVVPADVIDTQSTASSDSDASDSDAPGLAAVTGELEAKIAELTSTLQRAEQAAQQREKELLQEVTHLQEQMEKQAASFQATLQQQQDSHTRLQAELEAAKQVIFQLSQTNSKPKPGEAKSATKAQAALPAVAPLKAQAAEPELEPSQSKLVHPVQSVTRKLESDRKRYEVALHRILDHPTQPGSLPAMSSDATPPVDKNKKLSDTDMGWVD